MAEPYARKHRYARQGDELQANQSNVEMQEEASRLSGMIAFGVDVDCVRSTTKSIGTISFTITVPTLTHPTTKHSLKKQVLQGHSVRESIAYLFKIVIRGRL